MKKKCTLCGSDDLLEGLRVVDRGADNYRAELEIEMDTKPDAIFFRGTVSETVKATMCCDCGHVMLFANPGFAKNLKTLKQLQAEIGQLGDPTKHPLYKQFLKSDPALKYMEAADQLNSFAQWLRKQERNDS